MGAGASHGAASTATTAPELSAAIVDLNHAVQSAGPHAQHSATELRALERRLKQLTDGVGHLAAAAELPPTQQTSAKKYQVRGAESANEIPAEWQKPLANLSKRFEKFSQEEIVTILQSVDGHAGKAALALEKAEKLGGFDALKQAEADAAVQFGRAVSDVGALTKTAIDSGYTFQPTAAAKSRVQQLTISKQWIAEGGTELESLFAFTTLVSARWLLQLAKGEVMPERKGVVPAWQQLPPDAEVHLSELQTTTAGLPVGVLSYGWASSSHPDPTGVQLQQLVPLLTAIVADLDANRWNVKSFGLFWRL